MADAQTNNLGGSWNADGTILFVPSNIAPIYRIPARGGTPVEVTRVESPQQFGHRFPHFLPDGRHFLFFVTGGPGVQGVYVGSLDAKDTRRLFEARSAAVFAPPDYALFMRQETLFAQRLDLQKLELVGDPLPMVERVARNLGTAATIALSASAAGPLVYRTAVPEPRQLIWFDRSGKQIGKVGEPDAAEPSDPRLSPDGRTLAVTRRVGGGGNNDVWLVEIARGVLDRSGLTGAEVIVGRHQIVGRDRTDAPSGSR